MAANQLDAVDLAAVPINGQIHEDLMNSIHDVSPVDRPFCDSTGQIDADKHYKEWIREALEAASKDNARVDGSSSSGINDTVTGERLGNYHQIATKTIRVSDRGQESNTVGSSDELIRQLMKRQRALRRDEESSLVSRNQAIAGNGSSVAGKCAGIGAWIGVKVGSVVATTSDRGTGGTDPVLSGGGPGGGYPSRKASTGTKRALSETKIKTMMREAYLNGGNPTMAMSTPAVIEKLSDHLFTSSARVATMQSDIPQDNRTDNSSGGGKSGGGVVAQGSVNILVTNFGALELIPNRFQMDTANSTADLYLIDPELWERSYLQGYRTNKLARDGLAENREVSVDFSLCALNPEGNAVIADIDTEADAVA